MEIANSSEALVTLRLHGVASKGIYLPTEGYLRMNVPVIYVKELGPTMKTMDCVI
jgi:hypothetical protein